MLLNSHRIRGFAGKTLLGVATLGAGSAAILTAGHPASAAALLAQVQNLVTCGTTSACVSGTNTGTGPGVAGKSAQGYGVTGTSSNNVGVLGASSSAGGAGVSGQTTGANGSGVLGFSPHGYGVNGESSDGYGIFGSTGGAGTGVYGGSVSGNGVRGRSINAEGVVGLGATGGDFSGTTWGLVGRGSNSGAYPLMILDEKNNALLYMRDTGAIVGNASGTGPFGTDADFSGSAVGLIARAPANAYPFYATDDYNNLVFSIDGSGNVSYSGSMQGFARISGGAMIKSFSPKTTLPTTEDTGTARLVAGTAMVPLDPTFAASIDARSGYRVFLTPGGDTRGLFVAARTANGFMVRESQGGHATVNFDYRIVATTLGHAGERMAVIRSAGALPRAMKPAIPESPAAQAKFMPKTR